MNLGPVRSCPRLVYNHDDDPLQSFGCENFATTRCATFFSRSWWLSIVVSFFLSSLSRSGILSRPNNAAHYVHHVHTRFICVLSRVIRTARVGGSDTSLGEFPCKGSYPLSLSLVGTLNFIAR